MFIPDAKPSTLQEFLEFLLPAVQDGLFDSVALDDENSPTKVVCTKDGDTIFEIRTSTASPPQFTAVPFVAVNTPAAEDHFSVIIYSDLTDAGYFCMRCKNGIAFVTNYNNYYKYVVVIGKTTSGKTAFITAAGIVSSSANTNITAGTSRQYFTTCLGDNTALSLYSGGFFATCADVACDRTILSGIPVVGARGSTDSFDGIYKREAVQFSENGAQLIDGKQYGCIFDFAILDE